MKFLKKTLAVMLSLALGSSMVLTPAFAASFKELQGAINSNETGYFGEKEDIYAATDENGKRNVTLNGDVEREEGEASITISKGQDVTIDLNGNDINGKGKTGSVITVTGSGASLTLTDTSEKSDGAVTGGNANYGGGVNVSNGAEFTMNGGEISGNEARYGGGVYAKDSTVKIENATISDNAATQGNGGGIYAGNSEVIIKNTEISNNKATSNLPVTLNGITHGGGVFVNKSTVDMEGNTISGNTANMGGGVSVIGGTVTVKGDNITENEASRHEGVRAGTGGGMEVDTGAEVTLNEVNITNNSAYQGGGIYNTGNSAHVVGQSTVTMNGGMISNNTAETVGGGILNERAVFNVNGGKISENTAGWCGGGVHNGGMVTPEGQSQFIMNGGELSGNTGGLYGDDLYGMKGGKVTLPSASDMGASLKEKPVTGWYFDGGDRWGNGEFAYHEFSEGSYTGELSVKAAHNQYVGVSYYLDAEDETPYAAAEAEKGQTLLELDVESPEREGFTFDGWEAVEGVDEEGKVTGEVRYVAKWTENERPVTPTPTPTQPPAPDEPGVDVEDPDVPLGEEPDDEVEIEDEDVPLAGPVTRAQFIDYLWRHEGEPEGEPCTFTDVPEDHEYVEALSWAQANGIAVAFEDGSFAPDDLVTVSAARDFLNRFAGVVKMTMPALTALVGEDDDPVLNSDEVLAEFFGEE